MLAPSIISGCKPVAKCERPSQVTGTASHSASEEEVFPTTPLAPFNAEQAPKGRQEYPVWQTALGTQKG